MRRRVRANTIWSPGCATPFANAASSAITTSDRPVPMSPPPVAIQ